MQKPAEFATSEAQNAALPPNPKLHSMAEKGCILTGRFWSEEANDSESYRVPEVKQVKIP